MSFLKGDGFFFLLLNCFWTAYTFCRRLPNLDFA